jgi:hypothetical protein
VKASYRIGSGCLSALLALWGGSVSAQGLVDVVYSSDITSVLGVTVDDEVPALDDLLGTVTPFPIGSIPASADMTAYHIEPGGDQLFSLDTTVSLPGPLVAGPGDVVRWDGVTFTLAFDAAAEGIPAGVITDAVTATDHDYALGHLLLSFDISLTLPGTAVVADDEDLARWDGANFSLDFDGSAAGVDTALDLDGAYALAAVDDIVVSFDISGTVGGVTFDDEDLLQYDPTSGTWTMVYDGSSFAYADWSGADLDAVYLNADTDGDGIADVMDSCPAVFNSGNDVDGDSVDDVCDTCAGVFNPAVPTASIAPWMTLVSGQRSDDGDGTGNRCDFKYSGNAGTFIAPVDVTDMRNSAAHLRSLSNCGLNGLKVCGQFDHDELGAVIAPADVTALRNRVATSNGPNCGAACTPPFNTVGAATCSGPEC